MTDCICTGPARDAHDESCPVRKRNPRADKGDVDSLLVNIALRKGLRVDLAALEALRGAYTAGQKGQTRPTFDTTDNR